LKKANSGDMHVAANDIREKKFKRSIAATLMIFRKNGGKNIEIINCGDPGVAAIDIINLKNSGDPRVAANAVLKKIRI
jgi:hypothetical protein